MSEIQVVKLAPEDWRLYRQVRLEALQTDPQAFAVSHAEMAQRPDIFWQGRLSEAQAGEKSWLLFARAQERIVGMIGAFRLEAGDAVEIVAVYVSCEARGQGAGAALMAAILAEVSAVGAFQKAVLGVNASQTAAVALYQKFGFQIVAEKTGIAGDGQVHAGYWMEKTLDS